MAGKTIRVPTTRVDELRLELAGPGHAGLGPRRFRDLRQDRVRRDRLPGARQLSARARGRAGANDFDDFRGGRRARAHRDAAAVALFRPRPADQGVGDSEAAEQPQLPPTTVAAITGLVSASVESLKPEAVVIIDNFGRPLSRSRRSGRRLRRRRHRATAANRTRAVGARDQSARADRRARGACA